MKNTIIYLLGCCFLGVILFGCPKQDATIEEADTTETAPAKATQEEAAAPVLKPAVPVTDPNCLDANLDGDSDVDQNDFAILQGCMRGANVPADPNCAD